MILSTYRRYTNNCIYLSIYFRCLGWLSIVVGRDGLSSAHSGSTWFDIKYVAKTKTKHVNKTRNVTVEVFEYQSTFPKL